MSQPGSRRAADQEDTSQTLLDAETGTSTQSELPLSDFTGYDHHDPAVRAPGVLTRCGVHHRVAALQQPELSLSAALAGLAALPWSCCAQLTDQRARPSESKLVQTDG